MTITKEKLNVKSPNYRQYYASHIGIKVLPRTIRISFGNEEVFLPSGEIANVSECEIIMDYFALKAMINLLNDTLKNIEDEYGLIDMEEEEKLLEKQRERAKKEQEDIKDSLQK